MMRPGSTIALSGLIISLLLGVCSLKAQNQPYTFNSSSGTFTPLTGATSVVSLAGDDVLSSNIPLGFTFDFFGTPHSELLASSNGFLTFNLAHSSSLNENKIAGPFLTDALMPLWDDLDGSDGSASYLLSGISPNRVFTFEWLNYQWNWQAAQGGISFQVKLYETTNVIEFIYQQEPGALNSPSASIGIKQSVSEFLSLSGSSASVALSPNGFDLIDTKPANGQIYTFSSPGPAINTPSIQAINVSTPSLGGETMTLNWIKGDGSYRAVFMKQTSATETVPVSDNTYYPASASFGSASSEVGSTDWFCVYNGAGNSTVVSNLESGFPYRVQVIEYNGLADLQRYLSTSGQSNPITVTTPVVTPSAPSSEIEILRVSHSQLEFDLLKGNGSGVAIFMKVNGTGSVPLVDGESYTIGDQVGNSGWLCVYKGTTDDFNAIVSVSRSTTYRIQAVDFNGGDFVEKYNVDPSNAQDFTSLVEGTTNFTFSATTATFNALTGATSLDEIEVDDALSDLIDIGFTFKLGGVPFSQMRVSSNGFITLNPYATSSSTTNNLLSSPDRSIIAPLWDDLSGVGGQASYLTSGTTPNRVFTIEWLDWRWDFTASQAGISFQLKLHETDNRIEFVYRQEAGALSGADASIGIAFPNKGVLNHISLSNSGASPAASITSETNNIATKPVTGQTYAFAPNKAPQSIFFDDLPDKVFLDAPFVLTASTSSGLDVSFSSSNTDVATVIGNTLSIVGAGMTTITASQEGDESFNPALPNSKTLSVAKATQTIAFEAANQTLGRSPATLSATASSGLPVTFSTSSPKVSVSGNTINLITAGQASLTATQAGNANYLEAVPVQADFCVNPAKPTITVTGLGTESIFLSTSASSGVEWFKNGIAFSSLPSISVPEAGVYTVKQTVEGCVSELSDAETLTITGDIVDFQSKYISIFPNPTEDLVVIEALGANDKVEAQLISETGITLLEAAGNMRTTVDLSALPSGTYLIRISTGKRTFIRRVIKM